MPKLSCPGEWCKALARGTQTWLAIQEESRVVHITDTKTRRNVAREFSW